MRRLPKRRPWLMLLALLCVVVGVLLVWPWPESTTDAQWLSSRPGPRPSRLAFLGRWMWPVKRQLARVREKVTGAPRTVDLHGMVVEIDPAQGLAFAGAVTSLTNQSGETLFVFSDLSFEQALKKNPGVQVLTTPRMTVADGMQAQMAITERVPIGTSTNVTFAWVGWWLDVWPFERGRAVELACFFTGTERAFRENGEGESLGKESFIRTNVAFGARVTVPTNGALFLLSRTTNQNGKVLGALLSPGMQKR